jgi:hypothetical protein
MSVGESLGALERTEQIEGPGRCSEWITTEYQSEFRSHRLRHFQAQRQRRDIALAAIRGRANVTTAESNGGLRRGPTRMRSTEEVRL